MSQFYVYIIETLNQKFYTGYTIDLEKRMLMHQSGKGSKFVRNFGFKKVVYHETFSTKSEAMKREYEIKKMSREQKQKLINSI